MFWKFAHPSLSIGSLLILVAVVIFITNTRVGVRIREFRDCSQNLRRPPCYIYFCRICGWFYLPFMGYNMEVSSCFTNSVNILKIRMALMMCMPFPLSATYYSYFYYCFWGWGALAKAKEGQREKFK